MAETTTKIRYDFRSGAGIPNDAAAAEGDWVKIDTGAGAFSKTTGGLLMDCDGVALCTLYFGDALIWDIDVLIRVEFMLKFNLLTADHSNTTWGWGVSSANNSALDSITEGAFFKFGSNDANIYMESDDGTNNNDDVDSTLDIADAVWMRSAIDFKTGVQTIGPPGQSKGGKGAVQFYCSSGGTAASSGHLQHVGGRSQLFDMSNYAGGLQPFVQGNSTNAADDTQCEVMWIDVELQDAT